MAWSSAAPSWSDVAVAAGGNARTTTRVPGGRVPSRGARRCRRRRRTWLRTTAPPTDRATMNPAWAGVPSRSVPSARETTRSAGRAPPGRRRPARSVAANSLLRRNRAAAGSTPVRPRAASDPWRADRRGWRDRRGCASAGGTRGSSPADGCSAGRCACSLVGSRTTVWSGGDDAVVRRPQDRGAEPLPTGSCRTSTIHGHAQREGHERQHGHATAAVGTARPAHGTCARPGWSNRPARARPRRPPAGQPPTVAHRGDRVDARHAVRGAHRGKKSDRLWTTACWGPLRLLASPSAGKLPHPTARDGASRTFSTGAWSDADGGSAVEPVYTGCG